MPLPGRGAHFPSHLMLGGVRTPLLEDTPQRLHNRVVRPPEMSACWSSARSVRDAACSIQVERGSERREVERGAVGVAPLSGPRLDGSPLTLVVFPSACGLCGGNVPRSAGVLGWWCVGWGGVGRRGCGGCMCMGHVLSSLCVVVAVCVG